MGVHEVVVFVSLDSLLINFFPCRCYLENLHIMRPERLGFWGLSGCL